MPRVGSNMGAKAQDVVAETPNTRGGSNND